MASSNSVRVPSILLDWVASLAICISIKISISGIWEENASNAPIFLFASASKVFIFPSVHDQGMFIRVGEKLLYLYCCRYLPLLNSSIFIEYSGYALIINIYN